MWELEKWNWWKATKLYAINYNGNDKQQRQHIVHQGEDEELQMKLPSLSTFPLFFATRLCLFSPWGFVGSATTATLTNCMLHWKCAHVFTKTANRKLFNSNRSTPIYPIIALFLKNFFKRTFFDRNKIFYEFFYNKMLKKKI